MVANMVCIYCGKEVVRELVWEGTGRIGTMCQECYNERFSTLVIPNVTDPNVTDPTYAFSLQEKQFDLLLKHIQYGFNKVAASIRAAAAVPTDMIDRAQAIESLYNEMKPKES